MTDINQKKIAFLTNTTKDKSRFLLEFITEIFLKLPREKAEAELVVNGNIIAVFSGTLGLGRGRGR